jgi:hypothetical protein
MYEMHLALFLKAGCYRLQSCVLSWQSAITRRVVPLLLLGLSTHTAHRHVVTTLMVPLSVRPG